MAEQEHVVQGLADMELLAAAYGHFPEPFLHRHLVTVRVRGIDKVASARPMHNYLKPMVDHYGWTCDNLARLADLASVADALQFVREEILPFLYAYPSDPELLRFLRDAGFLTRALGEAVEDPFVQRKTNTLQHRMVFTAQRAREWDEERIRRRIVAPYGEISDLLDGQVLLP
ncbi:hypothetical protein SEVIR_1G254001v4 [Setaria viridis]